MQQPDVEAAGDENQIEQEYYEEEENAVPPEELQIYMNVQTLYLRSMF